MDSLDPDASPHIGHAHLRQDRFSAILIFLQNTLFAPIPPYFIQISRKSVHMISGAIRLKRRWQNLDIMYR